MRRGILGGTFDPPHIAHLLVGESAFRQADLDVVTFLPAGAPWQKQERAVSDARHRLAMVSQAVAPVEYFEVDDRELRRDGWTYTIDTVASFPTDEDLVLVVGADTAAGIPTWRRHEELLAKIEVAVVPRPDTDRSQVESALAGARYRWLDMPLVDVSSSALRRRAAEGRSIRFFVPDTVWTYVTTHDLYRTLA